jgi:DNA invertase Pin-like site-specific DNA recombinase
MIATAIAGGIDLIVTKEVSRFARNTVDTLSYTRKLSAENVRVIFINDNIDTKDKDSEFRLTIMASVAQEESRKTSERIKWGMTRRMERGNVLH